MKTPTTTPMQFGDAPAGVYIDARSLAIWRMALHIALDPYKAPEIAFAALENLQPLKRAMDAAVDSADVVMLKAIDDCEISE